VARLIEDVEVVAASPELRTDPETPGISRVAVGPRLPFFTGSLRGVVVEAAAAPVDLAEASRLLAPGARLVVTGGSDGSAAALEGAGLELLMESETVVVGARN
jgi:hypothetical protein